MTKTLFFRQTESARKNLYSSKISGTKIKAENCIALMDRQRLEKILTLLSNSKQSELMAWQNLAEVSPEISQQRISFTDGYLMALREVNDIIEALDPQERDG